MRRAAVEDCLILLKHFGVDPRNGRAIDVGGAEHVNLDGAFIENPIRRLCPDLTLLDGGFSVEKIRTAANAVGDFLEERTIEPLTSCFDLVFTFDTLEHVRNPFLFCEHLIAIAKPGGYVFAATVFSWSYHPAPEDYFRFSPAGLREVFVNRCNRHSTEFEVLHSGWGSDKKGVLLFGRRRPLPLEDHGHGR
ncbi:MAG: methyltransferase domain-containing protein [Planctomycetota bacterium]|nr:methyltransferase domain-containing protein [Planctomycetota bacterium]